MSPTPVHIALDTSNIFVGARAAAAHREGWHGAESVRIAFENLFNLARAGRPVEHAWAVGSGLAPTHPLWAAAARGGFDVEVLERGRDSHTEQGVDATLQVALLRAICDAAEPGILVIVSGDGAGHETGQGFLADGIRAHRAGFGIEVVAWAESCSRDLRAFAEEHGAFVDLTNQYHQITFLQGSRRATPLSLCGRPMAKLSQEALPPRWANGRVGSTPRTAPAHLAADRGSRS